MRCPQCAHSESRVVDSRNTEDGSSIRRRRECLACAQRFTTHERYEEIVPMVQKSDGTIEPFVRAKIVNGVLAAAKGRPLSPETAERIAVDIERLVRTSVRTPSSVIGRYVLERLRDTDEVAYLRFASVYKGFEDPTDFERELGLLANLPPEESQAIS